MRRLSPPCALLALLVPMIASAEPPPLPSPAPRPLRIALVGASIARGWQLDGFAARTGRTDAAVEYVGEYGFDKSKSVAALLARGAADRPDVVILKECGAYFPGDQAAYEALIRRWVAELRAAGIRPAVATVAPVAAPRGAIQHLKRFVRSWLLGREDQNVAIARYNEWLRGYAATDGLPLLDLAEATGAGQEEPGLDPRFDSGDGLHLNAAAYHAMDLLLSAWLDALARPTAP